MNFEPFYRVGVVARPYLRHIVKDSEIKSAAASRAAFKQNAGIIFGEPLHKTVNTENITVGMFSLRFGRQGRRAVVRNISVHVPFNIGNIIF